MGMIMYKLHPHTPVVDSKDGRENANNAASMLESAFAWETSPQGRAYWRNVVEQLRIMADGPEVEQTCATLFLSLTKKQRLVMLNLIANDLGGLDGKKIPS